MVRRGRRRQRLLDGEDARFERARGISTGGALWPEDGTVPEGDVAEANLFAAEHIRSCRVWLRALPRRISDFTFIDLGSGKGRALFFAASAGFGAAIGVEFVAELHEAAVDNIERAHGLGSGNVRAILGDATKYLFPAGPLVVHFNNPFREPIMERVIANLTAAYEREPRPIFVVYHQAWMEQPQGKTENIRLLADEPMFVTHRLLTKPRVSDRLLLGAYRTDVFGTRETLDLR